MYLATGDAAASVRVDRSAYMRETPARATAHFHQWKGFRTQYKKDRKERTEGLVCHHMLR